MNLEHKQNIAYNFDRSASTYDKYAKIQRKVCAKLLTIAGSDILKAESMLDIGCGTGNFHKLLRANSIYTKLTQVDIAYNMCLKAQSIITPVSKDYQHEELYTLNADMEDMPLNDSEFDLVFSSLSMQWGDLDKSLKEALRVLQKNKKFHLSIIGQDSLCELKDSFLKLDGEDKHINKFVSKDDLFNSMEKAGFKEIEIKEERLQVNYENVKDLLLMLKNIGATYNYANEKRNFVGKDYFNKLEKIYQNKYANDVALPATWHIIYASGIK